VTGVEGVRGGEVLAGSNNVRSTHWHLPQATRLTNEVDHILSCQWRPAHLPDHRVHHLRDALQHWCSARVPVVSLRCVAVAVRAVRGREAADAESQLLSCSGASSSEGQPTTTTATTTAATPPHKQSPKLT